MNRLFKRSRNAKYIILPKTWDFCTDDEDKGISEKWYEKFPRNSIKMVVPSCWNSTLGYFRYVGTAWYSTEFECTSDNVSISFEAVSNECDVYIDGRHIGYHYGAFNEFSFDAVGIGRGIHKLVVRVNNTTDTSDTIPHTNTDWYNYGGIVRPVVVKEFDTCHISSFESRYKLDDTRKNAELDINVHIETTQKIADELRICVDGKCVHRQQLTAEGKCEVKIDGIKLNDIQLWDINKPNLYYVTVEFAGNDLTDRIGFRTIETKGKDLYLNGRKIKIIGICRHEIHPDWGFSMPFELIKRDIDIIRDLNCNAIRGAHYPHSKMTLDYCDEVGMLFWEEIPLWGNLDTWAESFKKESFIERVLSMFGEMLRRDINHPSIVFWGLYNEIDTSLEQTRLLTEKMLTLLKGYDTSRLTAYATCSIHLGNPQDICSDLVDVVGFNYYTGWFPSVKEESFEEYVSRMRSLVDSNAKGRQMPMMMSEFGGGALKGATSFEMLRWSENYQSALLEKGITSYIGSDEMCGGFIWQFCNTQAQPFFELRRPGCVNNKGLVDEYRRPKSSYETVKKLYNDYNPDSDNVTKVELF